MRKLRLATNQVLHVTSYYERFHNKNAALKQALTLLRMNLVVNGRGSPRGQTVTKLNLVVGVITHHVTNTIVFW